MTKWHKDERKSFTARKRVKTEVLDIRSEKEVAQVKRKRNEFLIDVNKAPGHFVSSMNEHKHEQRVKEQYSFPVLDGYQFVLKSSNYISFLVGINSML